MAKQKKPRGSTSTSTSTSTTTTTTRLSPPPNGQHLLDVFQQAFGPLLAADDLTALVQEAKAALFARDFARAFSRPDLLAAYAARWSPTRAACYARVLARVERFLGWGDSNNDDNDVNNNNNNNNNDSDVNNNNNRLRVVAFGGATAELAALSAFLPGQRWKTSTISLVDLAPWQTALAPLYTALTTPLPPTAYVPSPRPPLSPASELSYTFTQTDALSLATDSNLSTALNLGSATLVTILFTLNELFSSAVGGVGRTTAFLLALTDALRPGTVLLVIDSPGSYAETAIGPAGAKRRYPVAWLLDHVLLTRAGPGRWEKLLGEESAWFRWGGDSAASWRYAIALEDMRFQMHVYRAL